MFQFYETYFGNNPEFKYCVKVILLARIICCTINPMKRDNKVNIREVAKFAGVSPSTVSRVLTGSANVSEEKRKLVFSALDELDYVYHRQAQVAFDRDRARIGIIIPKNTWLDLNDHPAFATAINSFERELTNLNWVAELILLDDSSEQITTILYNTQIVAFFILGTSEEQENMLLPLLNERGIPYILHNRWVSEITTNYVNMDDASAAESAIEYLFNLNHQEIAFIGGNSNHRNSNFGLKDIKTLFKRLT